MQNDSTALLLRWYIHLIPCQEYFFSASPVSSLSKNGVDRQDVGKSRSGPELQFFSSNANISLHWWAMRLDWYWHNGHPSTTERTKLRNKKMPIGACCLGLIPQQGALSRSCPTKTLPSACSMNTTLTAGVACTFAWPVVGEKIVIETMYPNACRRWDWLSSYFRVLDREMLRWKSSHVCESTAYTRYRYRLFQVRRMFGTLWMSLLILTHSQKADHNDLYWLTLITVMWYMA